MRGPARAGRGWRGLRTLGRLGKSGQDEVRAPPGAHHRRQRRPSPHVRSSGVVDAHTADIQYDPVSGLIYASLTGYVGTPYEGSIVSIDPATGLLE